MKKIKTQRLTTTRFFRILSIIIWLVLVWRGVWYVLDAIDERFFSHSHVYSAVLGIIIGLIILYIPDKDLKEIEKL